MLDALAYAKAARANGVPAALEISQSGRGAHVWVFFTEKISAATARSVGTALIHEAMVLRGSMDLRSYDRLFPKPGRAADGGLGNLIAAPLQGRRKADGLTVFLDPATLEPHENQWLFLATLDRLSPGDAQRVARQAKTDAGRQRGRGDESLGGDPGAPTAAAGRARGARCRAAPRPSGVTPSRVADLQARASMANPKFYELQRLRKSTWDAPRFVRGYDITLDDHLVLPRGLRHTVTQIVERAGSRLALTDMRTPGREIDVTFASELKPEQVAAVNAMIAHDDGVLDHGDARRPAGLVNRCSLSG